MSVETRFYDGLSPVEKKAELELFANLLIITYLEQDQKTKLKKEVKISQIHCYEILNGSLHLEFKNNLDPDFDQKLIIEDKVFIDKILAQIHARSGILKKTQHAIGNLRNSLKVLIVILIIPIFSLVVFTLTSISYLFIPLKVDNYIGNKVLDAISNSNQMKFCKNKELESTLNSMLREIGHKSDRFEYEVRIIKNPAQNAFALPGGKIFFFSGLLKKSESAHEVLSVLSHEISHVERRHGIQHLTKIFGLLFVSKLVIGAGFEDLEAAETIAEIMNALIFLQYSKGSESQADDDAINRMHNSGYTIKGLDVFLERISKDEKGIFSFLNKKESSSDLKKSKERLELLSTHPLTEKRVSKILKEVSKESPSLKSFDLKNWDQLKTYCK